ncbi:uncharacterized protein LOC111062206 [Nilaparvata lugens]|uniref:uncharacterized protein LOC111062206 n=1 Tax=Nilaparvata lugens TaxID=108931 RepID=UPI00193CCE92|nr:uncharacterized protein LOC111062206 [Nilaparvata lugens]
MPRSKVNCSVVGCHNNYMNTENVVFYSFPTRSWDKERREKWISSVKRIKEDGTPWQPTIYSRICSDHFISKKRNDHPLHPDYVPSVFPDCYKKRKAENTSRFSRLQKRGRLNKYKNIEAGENLPEIEEVGPPIVDKHFEDKCIQDDISELCKESDDCETSSCVTRDDIILMEDNLYDSNLYHEEDVKPDILGVNDTGNMFATDLSEQANVPITSSDRKRSRTESHSPCVDMRGSGRNLIQRNYSR